MVGENIPLSEEIVGIRIVDKNKCFKSEIWVKFNADSCPENSEPIIKWMIDCLALKRDEIIISPHQSKSKK